MTTTNVLRAHQVQIIPPPAANPAVETPRPAATPRKACNAEPKITLIKDGDIVRAVEVACTCGEIIRLECQYD